MKDDISTSILTLFFPEGILEYFDITKYEKEGEDDLTIFLREKNIKPKEYEGRDPQPRGFMDPRMVEDFPDPGQACKAQD